MKGLFGLGGGSRRKKGTKGFVGDEEERNVMRFDNDIVLRVNVTSIDDRIAITELAEVSLIPRLYDLMFCLLYFWFMRSIGLHV
jgi:hypothetical protein